MFYIVTQRRVSGQHRKTLSSISCTVRSVGPQGVSLWPERLRDNLDSHLAESLEGAHVSHGGH